MSETVDDITIAYFEEGIETVKELHKEVLSKGAWTTILFCYQEWDRNKEVYGTPKYSIRRYQKRNNQYWMKSKFNISSDEQARKITETLNQWMENS